MKNLLFLLCILCAMSSCGGDDPLNIEPEPPQPEEPYVPEEPDPFKGYLIKNKEGFDVNSINILYYNEDSTFLTGFKNEKLWVALFNEHTNEQLHEWNGTEAFDRTIDIDLGYGEHDIFEAVSFSFSCKSDITWGSWFRKTPWGYAFTPSFKKENGKSAERNVFLLNGDQIFVYDCEENYLLHSNWYQNSIVIDIKKANGKFENVVISSEGKYIMMLNVSNPLDEEIYPLSYTDGLCIGGFVGYYSMARFSYTKEYHTGQYVWFTHVPSLENIDEYNARINITVLEQGSIIWKFQINVTEQDGNKLQSIFTANVETGEAIKV